MRAETPDGRVAPLRPVTPVGLLAQQLEQLTGVARSTSALLTQGAGERETDGIVELRRLEEGLQQALVLAQGLDPYLAVHTSPESADLAGLARATVEHDWSGREAGGAEDLVAVEAEMLSGHVEGELLATLVAVTGARRVLEVGMFTGYAALAMAQALPDDGVVVACELDPTVARFARTALDGTGAGAKVDVRVGPAQATLAGLAAAGESFDLVFLDADKAGYRGYVESLLDERLLAPDGLLVVDNTLLQGEPWAGRGGGDAAGANGLAVASFNDWLAAETRVRQVIVPLRDGVTLVRWADGGKR